MGKIMIKKKIGADADGAEVQSKKPEESSFSHIYCIKIMIIRLLNNLII